jgi:8-oxo-dGTP pyrophosphatase MutT (NUDIX family)
MRRKSASATIGFRERLAFFRTTPSRVLIKSKGIRLAFMTQAQRAASIIVSRSDGKVLLQKRARRRGVPFAGKWGSFGGGVEKGETPSETAKRELFEELGINLSITFWRCFKAPDGVLEYAFTAEMPPNTRIRINPLETDCAKWFSRGELANLSFAFDAERILNAYFEFRQKSAHTRRRASRDL